MKINLKILITVIGLWLAMACGGSPTSQEASNSEAVTSETPTTNSDDRGIGPIKEISLTNPLDAKMLEEGKSIYEMKCASCHKLTEEKLVGPGWAGVTKRHRPEWIMNFTVNVEEMLNKDPKAMAMLEECLVRMPNQNLSEADARNVLEYMRQNDGEK
jgi:mono/diheme cytochrome c family protein